MHATDMQYNVPWSAGAQPRKIDGQRLVMRTPCGQRQRVEGGASTQRRCAKTGACAGIVRREKIGTGSACAGRSPLKRR